MRVSKGRVSAAGNWMLRAWGAGRARLQPSEALAGRGDCRLSARVLTEAGPWERLGAVNPDSQSAGQHLRLHRVPMYSFHLDGHSTATTRRIPGSILSPSQGLWELRANVAPRVATAIPAGRRARRTPEGASRTGRGFPCAGADRRRLATGDNLGLGVALAGAVRWVWGAAARGDLLAGNGRGRLHGSHAVWRGPGQKSQPNLGTGAAAAREGVEVGGTSGTTKGTLCEGWSVPSLHPQC